MAGVKSLAGKRSQLIKKLLDKLESKVQTAQRDLLKTVLEDFVDGLELDESGNVKNTIANKRRLASFDQVFNRFAQTKGLEVVKGVTDGVSRLVDFNQEYFSAFETPATLAPVQKQVKETLSAWLGVTNRGKVETNGYLDTLVKSDQVRNGIKNMVLKTVVSQGGYNELKKNLQTHIEGNRQQTGTLERYYRNFAYDTFSTVDRTAAKITADKLKFNYAIYEGGLIETSREFCEERNGKVFSREEIAAFDITEARPPNYDPFTDLGGYGCRHHLNWVPDAVAFAMRPELRNQTKPEPPKPIEAEKPKEEGKKFTPAKTMKEAKLKAVDNLTPYGLKIKAVTVDSSLPLETVNKYLKQIDGLTSEYDISPVGVNPNQTAPIPLKFKSGKRYGGYIKSISGVITEINFGSTQKIYTGRIYKKDDTKLRSFSRVDEDKGDLATLTHEFAHVIGIHQQQGNSRSTEDMRRFWDQMRQLKTDYSAELGKLFDAKDKAAINEFYLGQYASTNLNEFMAEAFTEYKLSSSPSPYASKVGKLIDKHFKRKK